MIPTRFTLSIYKDVLVSLLRHWMPDGAYSRRDTPDLSLSSRRISFLHTPTQCMVIVELAFILLLRASFPVDKMNADMINELLFERKEERERDIPSQLMICA